MSESGSPASSQRRRLARIRLALAGVGLVLLIGLASLLARALAAVEREQSMREQAVIDRVFDELEGTLAAFVAAEQARPFVQWRHLWVPRGDEIVQSKSKGDSEPAEPSVAISPLARLAPQRPWLLGYFQIEPDGDFATPLLPPEGEQALDAELRARVALLREHTGAEPPRLADAEPQQQQTNRPPTPQQAKLPNDLQIQRALDYQANQRLIDNVNALANDDLAPDVSQISSFLDDPLAAEAGDLDVRVEPFRVEPVGDHYLRMTREVWIGERRWTQGLLLDRAGLQAWLEQQVLGLPELAEAIALDWAPQGSDDDERPSFTHEFAAPFGLLHVRARPHGPIVEGSSNAVVALLLGILLALTLIGLLLAVDRTLATMLARAEERERFIAAVTHELRTPLTSIRMYSEMLEQGMVGDDERRHSYHRTIRREAERLSRLVEQVLTLARLEQQPGLAIRDDAPASLGEIIDAVVELLRPQAEQAGLELQVGVDPRVERVELPRDTLAQVLTNVLDNAIKFSGTSAQGPIELLAEPSAGGLCLRVRDRGPGIEPESVARIFEPFFRARRSHEEAAPGTGIGLALVRTLVRELGGGVDGHNREGGGFEVAIELPLKLHSRM